MEKIFEITKLKITVLLLEIIKIIYIEQKIEITVIVRPDKEIKLTQKNSALISSKRAYKLKNKDIKQDNVT